METLEEKTVDKMEWAKHALVASELMQKDIEELRTMKHDLFNRAKDVLDFLRDVSEWYGTKDNPQMAKYRVSERLGNRNDDDQLELFYDQTTHTLTVKQNGRMVVNSSEGLFAPGPWFKFLYDKYSKKLEEDIRTKEEQALKAQKSQIIAEIALIS